MARKLRIEFPGAVYHVMSRGDRREPIFKDDPDRERFVETLAEVCGKTDWRVHAYCLMPNHFHLVVETPEANLVVGMKWFLGTYTSRFNRRHKLSGHLFSGRYKALLVDAQNEGYLRTVCEYVHLNPVRGRLLSPSQRIRQYRWSSFPRYLQLPRNRPAWLSVDRVMGEEGIQKDSVAGRQEFERRIEERRTIEEPGAYCEIRRGWCWGSEAYRKELLGQVLERLRPHHYGSERGEGQMEKAERLVRDELKRLRWAEDDLHKRPKGDRIKLRIAQKLRAETAMTLKWVAERLYAGSVAYLTNRLYLLRSGLLD